LDEADFKKRLGFSVANKVYKACKVTFSNDGTPESVDIFDYNTKPSKYWWNNFLELRESRTDSHNTRIASTEVIKVLNRYKKDHPYDCNILRNSTIASFKQDAEMNFESFIENNFESYQPSDANFSTKLTAIVNTLKELPEKKNFDSQFRLVPGDVSFRRSKVRLSHEIDITYDEGIADIDNKIWSERRSNGEEVVVIRSTEGFSNFKTKNSDE
jgi:hypothetical protein